MAEFRYLDGDGIELIICKQSTISYPLHNHVSVFTLGFILDGAIELATDQGTNIYRENSSFIVLPYTPHCVKAKSPYTLLNLCVKKELVTGTGLKERMPSITAFLHDAVRQPEVETKIVEALNSLALIGQMLPAQSETAFSGVKMQLETYPEVKRGIDDMAQTVLLSKYDFIRSFKHEVGLTPHQFQIQNRVRKAQRMLKGSDTITEVALATGFCDQSHFIKQFEKIVGLTPTDYKRACEQTTPDIW